VILTAIDVETDLVQPGLQVPPLVCGSWLSVEVGRPIPGPNSPMSPDECVARLVEVLADDEQVVVGLNVFYDLAVIHQHALRSGRDLMPAIFAKLDQGLVWDVGLAEQLHAIALGLLGRDVATGAQLRGRYSLEVVVEQVLGRADAKEHDAWRLRYWQLRGVPLARWPAGALRYLDDDVRNPLEVALAQLGELPSRGRHAWTAGGGCSRCGGRDAHTPCMARERRRNLHDLAEQCRAAWALTLAGAHGFARDSRVVEMVADAYAREHAPGSDQVFRDAGITRSDGTTDQAVLKRLVARAYSDDAEHCAACAGVGKVPSAAALARRKPGSRAKVAVVGCRACDSTGLVLGDDVPRADAGGVSCSRDALFESGDDLLVELAEYREADKVPDSYLPYLRDGAPAPLAIRFNPLLETGRVSADGLILTFPRRPGAWVEYCSYREALPGRYYKPSLRESLVPRPGHLLASNDYDSGELVTWAQSCLWLVGSSRLVLALNAGANPHLLLAARMLGIEYDEALARYRAKDRVVVNARQMAKEPNFGYPGGMGPPLLVLRARMSNGVDTPCEQGPVWISDGRGGRVRGYRGIRFCVMAGAPSCGRRIAREHRRRPIKPVCADCLDLAVVYRRDWGSQWPESEPYFAHVSEAVERGHVVQLGSGRERGGIDFCSAANGYFQELLAHVAKRALYRVSRACYAEPGSVLYGSRVNGFFHDELITEHPEETAGPRADEVDRILVETMREICPDLAPAARAPGALMRRWDKRAEPARDASGALVPWVPPGEDPYCDDPTPPAVMEA